MLCSACKLAFKNKNLNKGSVIVANINLDAFDKIIVLDFGSQYNQLITRRLRDFGIYSEYKVVAETKDIPVEEMEIGYMPDDFKKVNETVSEYMIYYVFEYNGNQIALYKGGINYPVQFDSEKNSIETVTADGIKFVSYYNEGNNGFIWNDGKYIYTVKSTVDKDEALEIARHLK